MRTSLFLLLSTLAAAASIPQQVPFSDDSVTSDTKPIPNPRPLVIWHGLGDTAHSDGIDEFIGIVRTRYPGIYVHSIVAPLNSGPSEEQRAGWWGKAERLAEDQCAELESIPELQNGYDAMGFSQGGLFLRYIAQYCEHGDRMRNLITVSTFHPSACSAVQPFLSKLTISSAHRTTASTRSYPVPTHRHSCASWRTTPPGRECIPRSRSAV